MSDVWRGDVLVEVHVHVSARQPCVGTDSSLSLPCVHRCCPSPHQHSLRCLPIYHSRPSQLPINFDLWTPGRPCSPLTCSFRSAPLSRVSTHVFFLLLFVFAMCSFQFSSLGSGRFAGADGTGSCVIGECLGAARGPYSAYFHLIPGIPLTAP